MSATSFDLSQIQTDALSNALTFRALIGAGTSSFDGAFSSLSGVPSTFTPASHVHGNLSNVGAIGSTANVPIITGSSGVLQAGSFGSTANTFCQGNDARLTTNLGYTASTRVLTSSTGTSATLPLFNSSDPGLAPASGGGTTNFLRADGTWAAPAGGGGSGVSASFAIAMAVAL